MLRILFICHGNICRSPMAQSVMTQLVREVGLADCVEIDSAAVSTEEIGHPMSSSAQFELQCRCVPIVPHRARQVTPADGGHFDLLICMDRSNMKLLRCCIHEADFGKARLLLDYTERPGDVADPWWTQRYDTAYEDIRAGCEGLLTHILQQGSQTACR